MLAEENKKKRAIQKNASKTRRRRIFRAEHEASKAITLLPLATGEVNFDDVAFFTRFECEQLCRNEAASKSARDGVRVDGNLDELKVSCPRSIYVNGLKISCPFVRHFRRKKTGCWKQIKMKHHLNDCFAANTVDGQKENSCKSAYTVLSIANLLEARFAENPKMTTSQIESIVEECAIYTTLPNKDFFRKVMNRLQIKAAAV